MPRVISFLVLVGILLVAGAVFWQVMAPFLVPMFLAAVLVVVFKPLQLWVLSKLPGRIRISALVTTILIMLTVLIPTSWLGWKAYQQSANVVAYLSNKDNQKALVEQFKSRAADFTRFYDRVLGDLYGPLDPMKIVRQASGTIAGKFPEFVGAAGKIAFGIVIMVLALYYFLADGPQFVQTMLLLSPLDPEYEQELLNRFTSVSRAVVTASLVTAVAQGLLAGIGFYFAMNAGAPIFLLMAATMVLACVPFFGGASVWIPTCIWIYLFQETDAGVRGDTFHAIALAIYCGLVVSTIDNFIKPWVLHGQSNLHPLLAFLSILGGIAALGPVGILVGPMMVAFVQALLVMVNKELAIMRDEELVAAGAEAALLTTPVETPPAHKALKAPAATPHTNGSTAAKGKGTPAQSQGNGGKRRRRRK